MLGVVLRFLKKFGLMKFWQNFGETFGETFCIISGKFCPPSSSSPPIKKKREKFYIGPYCAVQI